MASNDTSAVTLYDLPTEILIKIFGYLKVKHRNIASLVCTRWREIIMNCPSLQYVLRLQEPINFNEPPLSLLKISGRQFSTIIFDLIYDFPEEIGEFYPELCDSVRELIFASCELDLDIWDAILLQFKNVSKVKVSGSSSLSDGQLPHQHSSVTVIDFSDCEIPDWYIVDYVKSIPNLKEIIISSSTYHLWDAREDCAINFDVNATHTAFGDWVKRICKMVEKVTFFYKFSMVSNSDTLLKELTEIPNLDIKSLFLDVETTSIEVFRTFCEVKGSKLSKSEIGKAQNIQPAILKIINMHCTNLKKLTLSFSNNNSFMILEKLSGLKNLEELVINSYDAEVNLTSIQLCFPKVNTLTINHALEQTNLVSFEMMLKSMPFLKHLDLSVCSVFNSMLRIIFNVCTNLEILIINKGNKITDEGLYPEDSISLNSLKQLEFLRLIHCSNITDSSIKKFSFAKMSKLELINNKHVTFEGIEGLLANCPAIEHLDLNGCTSIDESGFELINEILSARYNNCH